MQTIYHPTSEQMPDPSLMLSEQFARCLCAFKECSDSIQREIVTLAHVIASPETDEDERAAAVATIAEALFPASFNGQYGIDLEESEDRDRDIKDGGSILEQMDKEESTFCHRVAQAMQERGITQQVLAERIGVKQSAVSMLLSRSCRPQRRTVKKIAEALNLAPSELWPSFDEPELG